MKILLNGDWRDVASGDVASALDELGYSNRGVATALNGEFVPAATRSNARLTDGDRLEIVAPMQGG